jgi:hypothetical protein
MLRGKIGQGNDANCCELQATYRQRSGSDANKSHLTRFQVRLSAPPSLQEKSDAIFPVHIVPCRDSECHYHASTLVAPWGAAIDQ